MINRNNYNNYQGKEALIDEFYDELFFFREKRAVDVLRGYCKLKGNAINDYMSCHFATEFPDENDEEHFGNNGVAFYLDNPAVDESCIVVLTYNEFFCVVERRYEGYIKENSEKKEEVLFFLNELKNSLKL